MIVIKVILLPLGIVMNCAGFLFEYLVQTFKNGRRIERDN